MTGLDFVKAFEWARKHPSAYGRYAATEGEAGPDKQTAEPTSAESAKEEAANQTTEERN